ncbi:MAG: hypothetical protein HPY45_13785 [Anaerolineae bacterium]|nr:hypothetical protein [Anaerolineae bacterium]
MNIGDKITWAYRSLFILMLIWLRFIEAYIPAWGIWIVWAVICYFIFTQKKKTKQPASALNSAANKAGGGE